MKVPTNQKISCINQIQGKRKQRGIKTIKQRDSK